VQRLDDLAQRLDEIPPLIGLQSGEDALVDPGGHRFDSAEGRLAFGGEPHRIHARIAPGALAVQQSLLHQTSHNIGERGAVDPRLLDQPGLGDVGVVGNAGKNGLLARREIHLTSFVGEEFLSALTSTVQEVQGRRLKRA
jgi:hypothetical protein